MPSSNSNYLLKAPSPNTIKSGDWGWQDGLVGKGSYLPFNPGDLSLIPISHIKVQREPIYSTSCSLASIHDLWISYTHIIMNNFLSWGQRYQHIELEKP